MALLSEKAYKMGGAHLIFRRHRHHGIQLERSSTL
jgi:hypothetical protein